MEKIAFLGLGHMGAAMARHLLDSDYELTVWNRTAARAEPFAARGARVAADPGDAVRDADVVITMLTDSQAVHTVAEALVPRLRPGTVWIEMSTIGPEAVQELARRVPDGVTLVDAPVVGSTDKAEAGQLGILAGGDAAAAEPVLAHFGTVTRTGPLGSAAARKLIVNVALLGGVALVAEALALGDALGLDEETVRRTLASGPLAGAVPRAFAEGVHFDMSLAVKDTGLATDAVSLPLLEAVRGHYESAAADPELAHVDVAGVVPHIRGRKA
ncbi:NAD(P)-dependent oxidoreductase [Streptomyces odontomachi]|uniref:NAD(P)-dependent oxidoreductase n=1 Tax=Streptomyces odontomachi TaxID=2944940 RepID=UPI00210F21BF|nr:NAD(P)-dependent oxidoreductase [Streptomyces sp. ODS25]